MEELHDRIPGSPGKYNRFHRTEGSEKLSFTQGGKYI